MAGRSPHRKSIKVNLEHTQYALVKEIALEVLDWKPTTNTVDWDILWSDSAIKHSTLRKMRPYQKINHFPGTYEITRKNCLAKNLNRMRKLHEEEYAFYPRTWSLPAEYNELKQSATPGRVFIVKPEASSQGKGIYLTRSVDEFKVTDRCVVQEYIKDPLLLDGFKFDLRVYVLLAGCSPLRAFIHKEGLVRLATHAYATPQHSNLHKQFMHLTNYAINKTNKAYSQSEQTGHKRCLTATLNNLQSQGIHTHTLWQKIKDIVVKTLCMAQPVVAHTYKACQPNDPSNGMCFEVLGFDILIDNHLQPWLLEVNHSPSFTADLDLDRFVKSQVISDTLVLMNLDPSSKKEYESNKRQDLLEKIFPRSRQHDREKRDIEHTIAQFKRDQWERKHLGGFEKLFSVHNQEECNKYLLSARQSWEQWTGAKTVKEPVAQLPAKPKPIPPLVLETPLPRPRKKPKPALRPNSRRFELADGVFGSFFTPQRSRNKAQEALRGKKFFENLQRDSLNKTQPIMIQTLNLSQRNYRGVLAKFDMTFQNLGL